MPPGCDLVDFVEPTIKRRGLVVDSTGGRCCQTKRASRNELFARGSAFSIAATSEKARARCSTS